NQSSPQPDSTAGTIGRGSTMSNRDRIPSLSDQEQLLVAGFVLGDLTAEEAARLEELAATNPDIRREIGAMQASLELMPQALPLATPPAHLRQRIVTTELITIDPAAESATPSGKSASTVETVAPPAAVDTPPSQALSRPSTLTLRSRSILKWLAALVALFALLLAVDNFRLRNQLQLAQEQNLNRVAEILQQPTSRLIALEGGQNEATGTLLFTPGNWSEVIVSLGNLPPLPPDRIYRMWLSLDNGDVILCGEFNTEANGSVFVRFTPPESPPEGVKATELYVTQEELNSIPMPQAERVMEGIV
ncbi:MAG: anti-sigma factor, partial [Cyanobacteria bacterium P01_E01_bin.34]